MDPIIAQIKASIRDVYDFPKKGIIFKDITTAIKDPKILHLIADTLYEKYKDKGITKVVGIESRGFILGSILAYKLNAGLVLIRKQGKLPAVKVSKTYDLEYGCDTIEMHVDSVNENDVVLLHDDLLATGGTTVAAIELLESLNIKNIEICFLSRISELNGIDKLPKKYNCFYLIDL